MVKLLNKYLCKAIEVGVVIYAFAVIIGFFAFIGTCIVQLIINIKK